MKILLPPSEGKKAPDADGDSLDLSSLLLPQLRAQRHQVIDALREVSGRDDAQQTLQVGATVMDEVAANQQLLTTAAAPAHQLYTGVLFEALSFESLSQAQRRLADQQVLIFSALFGVNRLSDRLPTYRLAMGVNLSPFGDKRDPGRLGTFWRAALGEALSELAGDQLFVDCRSATYAAAFRPPAEQTLVVNSFTESSGQRRVVTHFAKQARGQLSGMLLRSSTPPETIDDVADIAAEQWKVEVRPAQGKSPHQLDLIAAAEQR